ncbi:MAG: hypothetical protein V4640_06845 [Verrucomicrobiota bacterium]
MKRILFPLALSLSCALGQSVFTNDFNGTLPAEVAPGTATLTSVQGFATLGPSGNTFDGNFLRSSTANVVRLHLLELPTHSSVSIGFLLAAIDSLDGEGSYPSGDYFHIKLDGVTIFRESLANAVLSQIQTYIPALGAQLARHQDLGFAGPGSYYTDSAYNFAVEPRLQGIPHTASTLTLEYVIEGVGGQDLNDESWAMDNLKVEVSNGDAPQNPRLTSYKVTYPVGTVPRFSGLLHGAAPLANATLQSSTDLGISDTWQDLTTLSININGSASFTDIPDPSADNAPQNFYRVKIDGP